MAGLVSGGRVTVSRASLPPVRGVSEARASLPDNAAIGPRVSLLPDAAALRLPRVFADPASAKGLPDEERSAPGRPNAGRVSVRERRSPSSRRFSCALFFIALLSLPSGCDYMVMKARRGKVRSGWGERGEVGG